MDCHEAQRLILMGEVDSLAGDARDRVHDHMAHCETCTRLYREVHDTLSMVRAVGDSRSTDEPIPGFLDEVRRRVDVRKRERRFQRYVFTGAAVVLLTVTTIFGIQRSYLPSMGPDMMAYDEYAELDYEDTQLAEEYISGADITELVDAYGIEDDTSIINALIAHSYQSLRIEDFIEFLDNDNLHMALASN